MKKKHQSWPWIFNLNYYPHRRRVLSISMKCLKQIETMKNFGGWQVRSHHILQKWLKQWWQIWENPGLVPLAFCRWAFFKPLASRRNAMLTTNQGFPPAFPSVPSISISIQPGSMQASSLVLQFNQQGQCMLPLTSFLAGTHCCIEGHDITPQSYCLPRVRFESLEGVDDFSIFINAYSARFMQISRYPSCFGNPSAKWCECKGQTRQKDNLRESARKSCPTTTAPASLKVGCRWLPDID